MKSPAHFLAIAARARLVLAGKRPGAGFWQMPAGRTFVLACHRQNITLARKSRHAHSNGAEK